MAAPVITRPLEAPKPYLVTNTRQPIAGPEGGPEMQIPNAFLDPKDLEGLQELSTSAYDAFRLIETCRAMYLANFVDETNG